MESELKRKGSRQQEQQHLCKQLNLFITLIHYYENRMQFIEKTIKGDHIWEDSINIDLKEK
jgi:hypothetical protein